ncbi:unnamed protein product, partial [Polarella glacialis]
EIEALQERIDSGESSMNPDMAAKLSSKPVIEREIEGLKQLAALEAHEAEKQATVDAAAAAEKAAAAEAAAARAAVSEAAAEAALAKKRREALEVLANISPTGEEEGATEPGGGSLDGRPRLEYIEHMDAGIAHIYLPISDMNGS